jgi:hypothetical protein
MANSVECVRRLANVRPTAEGGGVEVEIKLAVYDNGIVKINGSPVSQDNPVLSAARLILMMLEELEKARLRRTSARIGGPGVAALK